MLLASCSSNNGESSEQNGHQHNYSTDWTINVEQTCTEAGSKSHHCSGCDEKTDITKILSTGHSYGEWPTTKEPTETE